MLPAAVLISLCTLTVIAYLRFGDMLYPAFLQALLWTLVTALYLLNEDVFVGLTRTMYFVVVNGVFTFSLGCYIATYRHRFTERRFQFSVLQRDRVLPILFWVSLLGLPFFLSHAAEIGAHGPTGILLVDLRLALTGKQDAGFGPLFYLVPVAFTSAALHGLRVDARADKVKFAISCAVVLVYAIFMTGRTFLFLTIMLPAGVLLISRRLRTTKLAVWCLALMLVAFAAVSFVTGKGGADVHNSLAKNSSAVVDSIRLYLLGAIPAFDRFMDIAPPATLGANTFRVFLKVTDKLGLQTPPPPLIQPYVRVPMPTNVYTVYQPYFMDFSFAGIAIVQFLFGLWHGYLYRRANQGSPLFVCLYALFLYPLFVQFFQDEYLNFLIQCIVLTMLVYFLLQRNRLVERASVPVQV